VSNHYVFPPAHAYPLNDCLFRLKSDDAFRARYVADREAAMNELALDAGARAALREFDRERLVALGAHRYLVFMAELRLRMLATPAAFEHF
jgi:hypothetical protein